MRAPSLPTSGAVSRRKRPKLSLSDLTPPAQRPSSPGLAWAGPHVVRHLRALDSAKVPRAQAPSLPALRGSLQTEVALLKPERPNSARPVTVQPELARAASYAMRHLCALDSAKVTCAGAPSLPASGAVSSRKWPYLCLEYLTQPAQQPSSP